MNYIKCYTLICFILISGNSLAGTSQVNIDCSSSGYRASMSGYIPGDASDYNLSLTIDNKKSTYKYECDDATKCQSMIQIGQLNVIEKLHDGILIIQFYNDGKEYQGLFYAVPKTVKIDTIRNGFSGSFTGNFESKVPDYDNKTGQYETKKIELKCKVKYQI